MSEFDHLRARAARSLEANIVETDRGTLLAAGGGQFRTLWTRDFCFAVPGLMRTGHKDLVRRQLQLLLENQREDGLIVRGLDVVNPKRRVVLNTVTPFLPKKVTSPNYLGRRMRPEYLGEHKTPAIDSNVLVAQAICQYAEYTGDVGFVNDNVGRIKSAWSYYANQFEDGFIVQPPFSDWQDSANRTGVGLYLHVLLIRAGLLLSKFGIDVSGPHNYQHVISQRFFGPHLRMFRQDEMQQVPLESNLWILESELFTDKVSRTELSEKLRRSPLWQFLGVPVSPRYGSDQISWTTKAVGLRNYHDGLRWSWLIAEAARVSSLLNDSHEANRILRTLQYMTDDSDEIAEVYHLRKPVPFRSSAGRYRSESPFSWGAAKVIEAIDSLPIE